jgi:two-component system, chemotaxis family, chemotaxis protein CheY
MKALVVDDSRTIRLILAKMLESCGFEVELAPGGAEALAHLGSHADTSLILADWNMPGMTGLDLVKEIRRQPALSGVRIVMVTTQSDSEHIVTALQAGADEYVMKPFVRDAILEKINLLGFGL